MPSQQLLPPSTPSLGRRRGLYIGEAGSPTPSTGFLAKTDGTSLVLQSDASSRIYLASSIITSSALLTADGLGFTLQFDGSGRVLLSVASASSLTLLSGGYFDLLSGGRLNLLTG